MQFSILPKNSMTPSKRLTPHNKHLLKLFRPSTTDFFLKCSRPILEYRVHAMKLPNQLAPKPIINLQAMIA